ncbi:hypothetical protein [Nodosilinea sp. P-1105]|uniref:hypothetical protein n=1 Tax=Nodosilinea sp. P-1105 TaxID=2546229 RepID=UPI00146C2F64|nr:hypothetical protein [Nodosilinea sp. P-1105]
MRMKLWATLPVLISLSVLGVACDGGGDMAPPPEEAPPTEPMETPEDPADPADPGGETP